MRLTEKQQRQIEALKSIGHDASFIAKRFNISGAELKRQVKKYKKALTRKRIAEWKIQEALKQNGSKE